MRRVCERERGDTPGPEYTSTWCAEGAGPGIWVECRKEIPTNYYLIISEEGGSASDIADINPNKRRTSHNQS